MRAGALDRRITIRRLSPTQSGSGEEADSFLPLATVWAEKRENSGSERFANQQTVGKAFVTFRFRWSQTVKEVSVKHQIEFDGRNFDIVAVREIGRREGIEVDCLVRSEEPLQNA